MGRWLALLVWLVACPVGAQQSDPVLLHLDGKPVYSSEYQTFLNGRKSDNDRLQSFIDRKLGAASAVAMGLDTLPQVVRQMERCRRQMSRNVLTDGRDFEASAQRYYEQVKAHRWGSVQICHIYRRLPQNLSAHKLRQVEAEMDSLYRGIAAGRLDFSDCLRRYSDRKDTFWVAPFQYPPELEQTVFHLSSGEISQPVFTPQGLHIFKVVGRREFPPYRAVRDSLLCGGLPAGTYRPALEKKVDELKRQHGFVCHLKGLPDRQAPDFASQTLFSLGDSVFTGADFARFSVSHPASLRSQWRDFVIKSVLDYADSRLEQAFPQEGLRLQLVRDSLLHSAAYRQAVEVPSRDEAGLSAFFTSHQKDYYWPHPRYRGIVLHCTGRRVGKRVRKALKHLPEAEWMNAIRLLFNNDGERVRAEQGLFSPGDNPYVDDLVFKGADAPQISGFPYTCVLGRKVKGPDNWQDVGARLQDDYRRFLEKSWLRGLRKASRVEINQEVLKTVNNHSRKD